MKNDFETELKLGFLDEAVQLLGDAEQCFLGLESGPSDPELLDRLFRLAHNLKGSARAVGFDQVSELTHLLESLLLKLKKNELLAGREVVSLLLRCKDFLDRLLGALRENPEARLPDEGIVGDLKSILEGKALSPSVPAETSRNVPADPAPENAQVFVLRPSGETAKAEPSQKASTSSDESIRVSLARVEKLVNFVGELVILQTVLQEKKEKTEPALLNRTILELAKVTQEVQSLAMGLRMVPLRQTFQKMQRIVRDTSIAVDKKADLRIRGEDIEMDKTVIESIGDPLVHLVRNAVDHGLESADLRRASGKPESGLITLSAEQHADHVVIEVGDDGAGLDPERIRAKAIEKGLLSGSESLSEQEIFQILFKPGFSTRAEVSDISGRGVGLDVVKTNVEKNLRGKVEIASVRGRGTTFRIALPLTLAIADGMIVRSGEERYIIPLAHVHETLRPERDAVHRLTGLGEILNLRGENLPLHRLDALLKRKTRAMPPPLEDSITIVVRNARAPFGVLVDDVLGKQQVVVKRLGEEIRHVPGFSGSAILGDGCPGVILDLPSLVFPKGKAGSHGK